jgi:hypothetical protein
LIGILRSFETQETLIERLTRRSKAANMAWFIQQCFNDIFSDWGIPQGSNMLVYDPE